MRSANKIIIKRRRLDIVRFPVREPLQKTHLCSSDVRGDSSVVFWSEIPRNVRMPPKYVALVS